MRIIDLLHFVQEVVLFSFSLLGLLLARILPLAAILAASLLLHIFSLIFSLFSSGPSSQPPVAEHLHEQQVGDQFGTSTVSQTCSEASGDRSKLVGDAEKAESAPHQHAESATRQHAEISPHPSDSQSTVEPTYNPTAPVISIRPRVLPPSFSEIERILRGSSPGRLASGHSPIAHKKQSASSPKATASNCPAARSRSYENFMGKFRKHFLLDS